MSRFPRPTRTAVVVAAVAAVVTTWIAGLLLDTQLSARTDFAHVTAVGELDDGQLTATLTHGDGTVTLATLAADDLHTTTLDGRNVLAVTTVDGNPDPHAPGAVRLIEVLQLLLPILAAAAVAVAVTATSPVRTSPAGVPR